MKLKSFILILLLLLSCGDFNNPVDPQAPVYQGYETVASPGEVTPVYPRGQVFKALLVWNRYTEADLYHVQISANPAENFESGLIYEKTDCIENTFFFGDLPGMATGVKLWWRVRVFARGSWFPWSPPVSFTADGAWQEQIFPPENSLITEPFPVLSWKELPGSAGYEIRIAREGEEFPLLPEKTEVPRFTFKLTSPYLEERVYKWQIRPLDREGTAGFWSEDFHFTLVNTEAVYYPVVESEVTFNMGFSNGEADEQPVHQVTLTRPFQAARNEVSNALFCEVMNRALEQGLIIIEENQLKRKEGEILLGNLDAHTGILLSGGYLYSRGGMASHPLTQISWFGALAFSNYLSMLEGREEVYDLENLTMDPSRTGYRLPTEAEWEYCARGTDERLYPWGNTFDRTGGNSFFSEDPFESQVYPFTQNNGPTTPAGYFDGTLHGAYQTLNNQSPFGLFDLSGNVWEWCWDYYASGYTFHPLPDTSGPEWGTARVIRGGSWRSTEARYLRTSYRGYRLPGATVDDCGFRVVRGIF